MFTTHAHHVSSFCAGKRASADASACVRVRGYVRVYFGARTRVQARTRVSAPKRVSTFRQLGPRLARLAGVLRDVGVQREHRRVEHRRSVNHAGGMHRSRPAARHRGERARSVFDASQPYVRIYVFYIHIRVRVGRHAPWHAFECACAHTHTRVRTHRGTRELSCLSIQVHAYW